MHETILNSLHIEIPMQVLCYKGSHSQSYSYVCLFRFFFMIITFYSIRKVTADKVTADLASFHVLYTTQYSVISPTNNNTQILVKGMFLLNNISYNLSYFKNGCNIMADFKHNMYTYISCRITGKSLCRITHYFRHSYEIYVEI